MPKQTILSDVERGVLEAVSRLAHGNPFGTDRLRWEREALGEEFTPFDVVWHARADRVDANPNVARLTERAQGLADGLKERFSRTGRSAPRAELDLYRDLVLYVLYNRYEGRFYETIVGSGGPAGEKRPTYRFYRDFRDDLTSYLGSEAPDAVHLFACCFQIRRAFHATFHSIVGGSLPAARLRAQVWQSIFTCDLRLYQRSLYRRMGDISTLVTGPTGTGKELVARAIAHSRYIPFDPEALAFRERWEESFFPLNLAALSPTLIESELFGHRRGAFTGAVVERAGWLEVCPPLGTVFLDEIGEVDPAIQVKLLRVLETRAFQRLGDTKPRRFQGKVVAATNRDLAAEMRAGRFRADLYYRLCSDILTTPSLRERIAESPAELSTLVLFLVQRVVGEEEADGTAREVEAWIREHLGLAYSWPGNVRELAQCVSNVLIRREYRPAGDGGDGFVEDLLAGRLTADEVLRRYCRQVYTQSGSYEEAARRLGLDRRTVRAKVMETEITPSGG